MRIRLASGLFILLVALLPACGPSLSGSSGGGTSASTPPADGGGGGGGGNSGTAALTWNGPSTNADSTALADLAGYRVYQSTTSGSYTAGPVATVAAGSANGGGTATTTINNLAAGTYYFIVRAYDSSGNESAVSNQVSKTIP